MYSSDLSKEALLSEGACGMLPSTGMPMPGLVPNVSIGAMSAALKWCSSSKAASALLLTQEIWADSKPFRWIC